MPCRNPCRLYLHLAFTYSQCEVNLDQLCLFHQWEWLKCNGPGPLSRVRSGPYIGVLGPLRTRDGEPMTITLHAILLVEKVEPVEVRFTLRLRDQRSKWMQDGCQSLHGFLHGIEWIMFYDYLDYFQEWPLGGRPYTKPGDHGTPNPHDHWFILFYHVSGPHMNRNSLKWHLQ
jgi:hypothetical protein